MTLRPLDFTSQCVSVFLGLATTPLGTFESRVRRPARYERGFSDLDVNNFNGVLRVGDRLVRIVDVQLDPRSRRRRRLGASVRSHERRVQLLDVSEIPETNFRGLHMGGSAQRQHSRFLPNCPGFESADRW